MAEVKVNQNSGDVRVERVVCAQDTGEVINPEGVRMQIEGCITMGLGYCFTEEIRFSNGRILDENFDTYEIPRFSWTPKIETVLVANPEIPPQGCGEPAITSMGAVIANAVYDAVGKRMFTLPMTPARIKEAPPILRPSFACGIVTHRRITSVTYHFHPVKRDIVFFVQVFHHRICSSLSQNQIPLFLSCVIRVPLNLQIHAFILGNQDFDEFIQCDFRFITQIPFVEFEFRLIIFENLLKNQPSLRCFFHFA
jgi:hypothetical protein